MKTICRRVFVRLPLFCLAAALAGAATTGEAATAKPTVSFTNLKSGQKFTNAAFTVTGKAAGSAGVSNVFCSLNQGAWNGATGGVPWTNWTDDVAWIPGTNTFSVAAVDNGGNFSATNTMKVFYAVAAAMTVVINGNGTVKPNYNGAQLDIGAGYYMKATAKRGKNYGFRNWTDGSNNVITTGVKVSFLMASNLTLAANFGYTGKPTISVASTTTNSDGYPADFVIHGTTKDSVGVTNVYYQLNNGSWLAASTSNNWANWTANVRLSPGGNIFNAYAVNSSNNASALFVAQLVYNSAPASLAGQSAIVTDMSNAPIFTVAFGKSTFSQYSPDTNNISGVGTYTYTPAGGGGTLRFRYTTPPSAVNKAENFSMAFLTPSYAQIGITNSTRTNGGYMHFAAAANLAPAKVAGQLVWSIGSQGDGNGTLYQATTYASTGLISGETNAGSYTYTTYSPVGALFKLTGTNGTAYVLANFEATNYGAYSEEDYTAAGQTNGTDSGRFILDTQTAGGNAPLTVSNRNLHVSSVGGTFDVQFGADTYSQASPTTNYDNDVGSYAYTRAATNIGQLNLAVTEPPTLAGTTNAARLIFVGGNLGLFTNEDGTISSFVLTSVTNLEPVSITSNTLNLIYISYYLFGIIPQYGTNQFQFDTNNNFTFNGSPSGTCLYQPFSPTVAMIQFNFTTNGASTNGTELDWLRLNFNAANSGNYFDKQFDTETNFLGNISGSFLLQ